MFSILKSLMKIGFFSYGGGNAIIPFLHKEMVEQEKLSEEEFNKNILITNITPGTAQVKMASSSCYSNGTWMSVLAAYAVSLPSFILVVLLLSIYTLMSVTLVEQIDQFTVGIYIFVAFMLLKYIQSGFSNFEKKDRRLYNILFFTTIFLTFGKVISEFIAFFISEPWVSETLEKLSVNNVYIFFGAFCIAVFLSKMKSGASGSPVDFEGLHSPLKLVGLFALISFIAMLPTFYYDLVSYYLSIVVSTVTSFGGGSAYVSAADAFFVQSGMVSQEYFYGVILLIAYALPGPTLTKVVSGVGFYIGYQCGGIPVGLMVAFASLTLSIFATNLIFVLAQWGYSKYSNVNLFETLKKVILPVIYGVLVVTIISVINLSMEILLENGFTSFGSLIFILASLVLVFTVSKKSKLNDVSILLICGMCSLVFLNIL